jgi:hypothetical protein
VPPFDKHLQETCVELFCRVFFHLKQAVSTFNPELGAYFVSLSVDTVSLLVKKSLLHCLEYNSAVICNYLGFWIAFNPATRIDGLELFKYICFEKIPSPTLKRMADEPTLVLTNSSVLQRVYKTHEHIKKVEEIRKSEDANLPSSILPFTILSAPKDDPPPSTLTPPSLTDLKFNNSESNTQVKVFNIGVQLLLNWMITMKSHKDKPACCTPHICNKYTDV